MFQLQKVGKQYGDLKVLENVSLTFEKGLYGLLGENGSGKSTMIKMMTMNLRPDAGCLLYDKTDIWELGDQYRSIVGYVPQNSVGYHKMKVKDFMDYMAAVKGLSLRSKETRAQIDQLLERVHLQEHRSKKYGQLSGGMKRRALLAQAMLGNPKILILDEPTAGLDPKERMDMKNLIAEQSASKTVILATHIITDVECVANKIVFMKRGNVLGCKTPEEWIAETNGHVGSLLCEEKEMNELKKEYIFSSVRQQEKGMETKIVSDDVGKIEGIKLVTPNLEDAYAYHVIQ